MDLDKMLADALARIQALSVEEFEQDCKKFGYEPVRRSAIKMSGTVEVDWRSSDMKVSYRHNKSITLKSQTSEEFGSSLTNDNYFSLAA
ncbi:hypothetical protein KCG43_20705 [Photobacterium sp. WH24]|uniref:hypothetical protein n=1 Tax=Photobacterium sp. WH24 TaxID=2827237 RepID=UPI001C452C0A|nr:hypothetical protein [Photobacterium sp. WH24]MBV7264437.1 hypothetical protein [Photobacterium sp. WH24]